MRRAWLAALVLSASACATAMRRTMPSSAHDWLDALTTAKADAAQGHYDDADRVLYDFSQRYAGAPEAREAAFWRALFKLDPANRAGSPRAAEEQLGEYLGDTAGALHRAEAQTLLRLAGVLDSLVERRPAATTSDPLTEEAAATAQQRADELQKELDHLRDELAKKTDELNRIKKRLSDRPPSP